VTEKRHLPVDIGDLIEAMTFHVDSGEWFLDVETGEVLWHSDPEYSGYDDSAELEGRSLHRIEPTPSYEAYEDMVDFAQTVEDEGLREKLAIALDGKGAFRRFKNVLLDYPEERQRWFQCKDRVDRQRALEFLDDLGIEPTELEGEPPDAEQWAGPARTPRTRGRRQAGT